MSVLADQSSVCPVPAAIPVQPVKRGRGRPKGSKNKPKSTEDSSRPSCPDPRGRGRRGRTGTEAVVGSGTVSKGCPDQQSPSWKAHSQHVKNKEIVTVLLELSITP